MLYDIEFFHFYPSEIEKGIPAHLLQSIEIAKQVINTIRKNEDSYYLRVMIDDYSIRGDVVNIEKFLSFLRENNLAPHYIIYESEMTKVADVLLDSLNSKYVQSEHNRTYLSIFNRDINLISTPELQRSYLALFMEESNLFFEEGKDYEVSALDEPYYKNEITLVVEKEGVKKYSCAFLAACWYLLRLGYWGEKKLQVNPIYQDNTMQGKSDILINILPYVYLKIEANVFDILEYSKEKKIKKARKKIKYIFY